MDRQRNVMVTMTGEQFLMLRLLAAPEYSLHGFPVDTLAPLLGSRIRFGVLLAIGTTEAAAKPGVELYPFSIRPTHPCGERDQIAESFP